MRYYRIEISDPSSGRVVVPPGFDGLLDGATYTSFANGKNLANAWDVELDVPVIGQATPQGFALCRVWGISLQEIGQANDLVGKNISIFGGMQKGYPLANPRQSGLLVKGYVFQAFGNWVGTDQTLDLVIYPGSATGSSAGGAGTVAAPKNLVLNWKAGTTLAAALASTLKTAFPNYKQTINLNSGIVRSNDEVGFYPTLEQLSQYVMQTSLDVIKTKGYQGASIVLNGDTVLVSDGSSGQPAAKKIAFTDLIGQPTWIEAPNISIKAVMRADLSVWDPIELPPTVTTNTAQGNSSLVNQRASFQGGFRIVSLRHVGRFRQPSADAWVTVAEAAPNVVTGVGG